MKPEELFREGLREVYDEIDKLYNPRRTRERDRQRIIKKLIKELSEELRR